MKRQQTQCNIPEDLKSCLILLMANVNGGVWDMKSRSTGRFWVRSTESINLWLIITCILLSQGYSESSLPWARHGYAVQIAFLSSRVRSVGRSIPCAVSHTGTCAYGSRPNVGRMQRHVMNVQPLSLLNKLGNAFRVLHFWPIRRVIFPSIPECVQCSQLSFGFLLGMIIILDRPLYLRSFWRHTFISRTLRCSRRRRCIIFLILLSQMPRYHVYFTYLVKCEMFGFLYLSRKRRGVQFLILVS